jgi:hypothetical protein
VTLRLETKEDKMGVKMTGKNREKSWCGWFCHNELKRRICESLVLRHADPTKRFVLETDASDYAYGAVLSQKGEDGKFHPVAFYSKSMTPAERNYGISDKEALAIIKALQHWCGKMTKGK